MLGNNSIVENIRGNVEIKKRLLFFEKTTEHFSFLLYD